MTRLEPGKARTRILVFTLLALAALALAELATRFVVPRASRIEGRVAREIEEARRPAAGGARKVLVVGNSLLNESVDEGLLRRQLAPSWDLRRLVIESSNYNDWYFGLRRLLAEGAGPDVVVLMLSASQLATDSIRGTYSAYHLFTFADSIAAGRRAGLHPTEISGLAFGHVSAYYGLREELRKFAFQRVIPSATELVALLVPPTAARPLEPAEAERRARARFAELGELCASHRVRCQFVIAPRIGPATEGDRRIMAAGESLGLRTASLHGQDDWSAADFGPDRFHMNPQGAIRYTQAFGGRLRDSLDRP